MQCLHTYMYFADKARLVTDAYLKINNLSSQKFVNRPIVDEFKIRIQFELSGARNAINEDSKAHWICHGWPWCN